MNSSSNKQKSTFKFPAKKQIFSILFIILLSFGSIYLIAKNLKGDNNVGAFSIFDHHPEFLFGALVCMLLYIGIEGVCIKFSATCIGERFKYRRSVVYASNDIYFSAITPSATGGQPVAVYYMMKDGISLAHSSAVLLINLTAYTVSLIILAVVAFAFNPDSVLGGDFTFKLLYVIGIAANLILLGGTFLCMYCRKLVEKLGNFAINLLSKIKLIKNPQRKRERLSVSLNSFQSSIELFGHNKLLYCVVLLFNILQRLAIFSVPFFIYLGFGLKGFNWFDFIIVQTNLAVAVNCLPLPGGVGASEFVSQALYTPIFMEFMLPGLVLTRSFSFYICFTLCGVISIINHISLLRKTRK